MDKPLSKQCMSSLLFLLVAIVLNLKWSDAGYNGHRLGPHPSDYINTEDAALTGMYGPAAKERRSCTWDSSVSFADFIGCVRRKKRRTRVVDLGRPDCQNYITITQPERRVGNVISSVTRGAICDRTLKRQWYRFDSPAGGKLPEKCVNEFSCGTHAPVWMNGKHPTRQGQMRDVEVCMSLGGHCCFRRWYIRVAHCGDFFVYLLTETPGCYMGYCAGTQLPCPSGQSRDSSAAGEAPCSHDFPQIDPKPPALTVGTEGNKVVFYCDNEGQIPQGVVVDIEWYVSDGHESSSLRPVFTDHMIERRRSILSEGYWMDRMGSHIHCLARMRWRNGTGVPGPATKSNKYFAGIKVLTPTVNVSESGGEGEIVVQATVPVKCLPQFRDACALHLEFAHDSDYAAKYCIDGKMRQVVFGDCSIAITPQNWRQVHRMPVKAVRDFYGDGNKRMLVNFKPIFSTTVSPVWSAYRVPDVNVVAESSPTKTCLATGDPHITTFDGLYYHLYLEGEFVLYRNTKHSLQVNTRLEKCGHAVTCNCAVAVRAKDDVIVIDRCMHKSVDPENGKTRTWRSLHRHAVEQGGTFSKGLKIYEYDAGKRYTVHLPSGAYVDFKVGDRWINIHFHASSDDWQSTVGLCGTFDKDYQNDLLHANLFTLSQAKEKSACGSSKPLCEFAESWRVTKDKSLFKQEIKTDISEPAWLPEKKYCKCEKRGSKSLVICNYNYDVDNCRSNEDQRDGLDKTETLLHRHRVRRAAEPIDDEDIDYFNSEFVYDENFVGQEPDWPTPSGITLREAKRHCSKVISETTVGKICRPVLKDELETIMDSCITDVKVMDDLVWIKASVHSMTTECAEQIHSNGSLWLGDVEAEEPPESVTTGPTKPPIVAGAQMLKAVCPSDCSRRGHCVKGTCKCYSGFTGSDCSTKLLADPVIKYLSSGGVCDINKKPCRKVHVYGENFRNVPGLGCHFHEVEVTTAGLKKTQKITSSSASMETFEEVACDLPPHDVKKKSPGVRSGVPSVGFLISISNDEKTKSDQHLFVVYDSVCTACVNDGQNSSCRQKTNACTVKGMCFASGDPHPRDCCKVCNPVRKVDGFVKKDNRLPDIQPKRTTYDVKVGKIFRRTISATDPDGCGVKYDVGNSIQPGLTTSLEKDGVHVNLVARYPRRYSFQITANDACGGRRSMNYVIIVQPDRKSTIPTKNGQQTGNCKGNRAPYYPDYKGNALTLRTVFGEILKVPIIAKDPNNDTLDFRVTKQTKRYVSISASGELSYKAARHRMTEPLTITAQDPCGARRFLSVHVLTEKCLCRNAGKCIPEIGKPRGQGHYRCQCLPGYTGTKCNVDTLRRRERRAKQ